MRTPEPPDQAARRAAIEDEGHNILLQAGAGSGKTSTLVSRLEWLLAERDADLSRIVAITFTEKAAGELKDRIRDLCDLKVEARETPDLWRRHRRSVDTAHVGTIHGFCSRLLRAHAVRIGIDPLAEVLDDTEAQLLLRDTLRRFVLDGVRGGNAALASLLASLGLWRLVRVLVFVANRRAKLDPEALAPSPEQIVARWRDAQAERVAAVVTGLQREPALREAAARLREVDPLDRADRLAEVWSGALGPAEAAFEGTDPTEALVHWGTLARLPKAGRMGRKDNWPNGTIDRVREALAVLREGAQAVEKLAPADESLESRAAELTAHFDAILPEALAAYAAAKRERGAVDFDDQLLLARDLLRDHPDVRQAEQERFDYLLVDEFQDTDPIQREIIWRLAEGPRTPAAGSTRSPLLAGKLLLVGDAKQSIYGFRGADVTVYDETRIDFGRPEDDSSRLLSLTANFRSQARLVSFFNGLFAQPGVMGPDRPERAPYEAHYEPLLPTRPPAEDGPDVAFLLAVDAEANLEELRTRAAAGIARYLTEAVGEGRLRVAEQAADGGETWRAARWEDVLVLVPTMSNVPLYERAFREHGVPYYVVAGQGFFARPEIMDAVALLTVLDEPRDELSLARVLRAPWCGVSDEGLYWLARENGLASGLAALGAGSVPAGLPLTNLSPADADRARDLARVLAALRGARHHLPLADLIERLLEETGLPTAVAPRFDGARAYANLRKLVEIARSFEASGPTLLSRFIEHVETLRLQEIRQAEAPAEGEQGNVVTMMTIHKAKGLQRPIVVVADLARGSGRSGRADVVLHPEVGPVLRGETAEGKLAFPPIGEAALEEAAAREEAEHRRLLYVALTRARDHLVISTPVPLDGDGNPSKGGVWVQALLAAFGEALLTEDRLGGRDESGEWAGEIIRLGAPTPAGRAGQPSTLLYRHLAQIEAGEALPGGESAEEEAILARTRSLQPDLAAKARFTVTELAHYLECPRRYELAHVQGLAGYVEAHEAPAAGRLRAHERGTVVHRALQRLGRGPVSEVREEVEAAARECGLAGHDAAEMAGIVALLVRFTGSETWDLVRTARELRSEVTVVAPLAGGLVEGHVDALLRDRDGALHLIDYKTGRSQDVGTLAEHRFQVGAYAAAIRQARGRLPATVTIHYLDAHERVPVDPSSEADAAERLIAESIEGIRAGRFPRKAGCRGDGCPYAWVCGAEVR